MKQTCNLSEPHLCYSFPHPCNGGTASSLWAAPGERMKSGNTHEHSLQDACSRRGAQHSGVESTGAGVRECREQLREGRRDRGGSPSFGFHVFLIGEKIIELPTSYIAKNHQLPAPAFHKGGCLKPNSRQVHCRLRNCSF